MTNPSKVRTLFAIVLLTSTAAGCGTLASFLPGSASAAGSAEPPAEASYATESTSDSQASSYSRSSSVEEVNGVPVNAHARSDGATPQQARGGGDFGATCTEMDECASRLCFIGREGNVGFCTRTCESWSDCPSHWECQRPSNAAQNVCRPARDD